MVTIVIGGANDGTKREEKLWYLYEIEIVIESRIEKDFR